MCYMVDIKIFTPKQSGNFHFAWGLCYLPILFITVGQNISYSQYRALRLVFLRVRFWSKQRSYPLALGFLPV